MDHLPLPQNPVIGILEIPFLCEQDYDGGDFRTYPARIGWSIPRPLTCFTRHENVVTNDHEICAFLQTWLYFGLIQSITGTIVDAVLFKEPTNSGSPRFSSARLEGVIQQWSLEVLRQARSSGGTQISNELADDAPDLVELWFRPRYRVLRASRDTWLRIVLAYKHRPTGIVDIVCLSIAALGEYLGRAMEDMALEMNLDCGNGPIWLAPHHTVIRPLLQMTSSQAWCPNKLQGLLSSQNCAPSLIWFISNLEPPVVHDRHENCTTERCNSLHVHLKDYETKHIQPGCQCDFHGPCKEQLAEIVSAGSIATFTVRGEGRKITLALHDQATVDVYVAISHVWADGCGNQRANELPACVLRHLQDEVNTLALTPGADTPSWIDTICLPRYSVSVRRQAISRLSEIFDQANGVLVRDSYLRSLACADMNPIEILARVSVSGWTQRLWTFSEGLLAQKIWFQFRDSAVDLFALVTTLEQRIKAHRVPPLASTSIAYEMTALYLATGLQSKANGLRDLLQLSEIRAALSTRQTSWASDEALCLEAALHLDLAKIAEADDDHKMAVFWQQVPYLPSGMIFAPCSQKLTFTGVRWAPTTLLGGSNQSPWFQFVDEPRLYATPSAEGLLVTLPAIDFEAASGRFVEDFKSRDFLFAELMDQDPTDARIVLRAASGLWYECLVRGDWHQMPIEPDGETYLPAILLHMPVDDDLNDSHDGQLDDIKQFEGLLVTFTLPPSSDPAALVHAKAHFHLKIERLSSEMNTFLDKLSDIAASSAVWDREEVSKVPPENEDKLFDILRSWVADHPAKDELVDLAAAALQIDMEEALDECADYVEYFFLVGEWYKTDASYKNWCID